MSGWVRWGGGSSWQRLFDFGQNPNCFFYLTPSDASQLPQCAITPNLAVYNQVIESPLPMPVNQWTHVAVVMDGRQGILYLNGSAVAVNNSVNLLPSDIAPTNCNFGKSQFSNDPYFNGRLSAMRLNSSALPLVSAHRAAAGHHAAHQRFAVRRRASLGLCRHGDGLSGAPLSASAFTWTGELHSNGLASAAFGPWSGITNGTYLVPANALLPTNAFYRVYLTVADTNGYQQSVSQDVAPQVGQLALGTVPPGLQVALDGQPLTTPASVPAVVGMSRLLAAPSPQAGRGQQL